MKQPTILLGQLLDFYYPKKTASRYIWILYIQLHYGIKAQQIFDSNKFHDYIRSIFNAVIKCVHSFGVTYR